MNIDSPGFRMPAGEKVDLILRSTGVKRAYTAKKKYHKQRKAQVGELIVSQIITDTLQQCRMHYPDVKQERRKDLKSICKRRLRQHQDE